MAYDIDIHQLNSGKSKNLRFFDEIPFKKYDFLYLFSNQCIILYFFRKKPPLYQKRKFHKWALHYFFNFLFFSNVSWIINMKPYLWPLKNCKFYILCTLILSNPLHLNVGSKLILTQNELWVPKCCCENSKVFYLCLK
jgi:hypothetical protein